MKSFDPACLELAQTFIDDAKRRNELPTRIYEQLCDTLASRIQETIEDFLEERNLQS